ncbi:MAG: hypothetical protein ACKKL5_00590 [Candidatus Komeilibacteria bacterium]
MWRANFVGTKFGGGNKLESESEGGQKFLPPNPLPFCPPERLDFKIRSSDFAQKKFEHQSKNTANLQFQNFWIFYALTMWSPHLWVFTQKGTGLPVPFFCYLY